jgi:hypothetical protein
MISERTYFIVVKLMFLARAYFIGCGEADVFSESKF